MKFYTQLAQEQRYQTKALLGMGCEQAETAQQHGVSAGSGGAMEGKASKKALDWRKTPYPHRDWELAAEKFG